MAVNFFVPNADTPVIDKANGLMTEAWYIFFTNLLASSGSGVVGGPTDVLHGPPVGFAPVDLTSDVSGRLPLANLSTGLVGRILIAQGIGNDSAYRAMSGDATINSQGVITVSTVSGLALGPYATATLGQLPGATGASSASAGNIAEFMSSTVTSGGAVQLTTAAAANVTSISLTAGDWNVFGSVVFAASALTTVTQVQAWTSVTSATAPTLPNSGGQTLISATLATSGTQAIPVGVQRVSLSATTTVYLSAQSLFGVSTQAVYGFVGARRAR